MTDHWLFRLDAAGWLDAAETELHRAGERKTSRRPALTHARRAGGMALNAVLVAWAEGDGEPAAAEHALGRSYLDHLRAVADETRQHPLPTPSPGLARRILEPSLTRGGGQLVQLSPDPGSGDAAAVDDAIAAARELTAQCAQLCNQLAGET